MREPAMAFCACISPERAAGMYLVCPGKALKQDLASSLESSLRVLAAVKRPVARLRFRNLRHIALSIFCQALAKAGGNNSIRDPEAIIRAVTRQCGSWLVMMTTDLLVFLLALRRPEMGVPAAR